MLQIGELSERVDVSAQTIRYYERIGVLPEPERAANDYRVYGEEDVSRLRFVRRARALNFSLDDIEEILDLRDQGAALCTSVKGLLENKSRPTQVES